MSTTIKTFTVAYTVKVDGITHTDGPSVWRATSNAECLDNVLTRIDLNLLTEGIDAKTAELEHFNLTIKKVSE